MNSTLQKDVLTETYNDMQNLLYKITWDFCKQFHEDFDDTFSQVNLFFIYAMDRYDETKSDVSTWLSCYIPYKMLNYIKEKQKTIQAEINVEYKKEETSNLSELLDELGKDSHFVLQLYLETPTEIYQSFIRRGKKHHIQGFTRRRIQNKLRQQEWTVSRIRNAMNEIKTVFNY